MTPTLQVRTPPTPSADTHVKARTYATYAHKHTHTRTQAHGQDFTHTRLPAPALLQVASVVDVAYARACRNCYWSGPLWVGALRAQDRHGASKQELGKAFRDAMKAGIQVRGGGGSWGACWGSLARISLILRAQ